MYNHIEMICVVIGVLVSIVALIQSRKSNNLSARANALSEEANVLSEEAKELSKEANELSQEALADSQKDYLPIIIFQDTIKVVKKDFTTLCNGITFDFDENLLSGEEYGEYVCVCAKIRNIGEGFLTGIRIKEILIKSGNQITNDNKYPFSDENDQLLYKNNCNLWQFFVLSKEDNEIEIYFMLTDAVKEYKEFESREEAEQYIIDFFEESNITICLSLQLSSVNNSKYTQDFLASTYLNKKVVRNSFNELIKNK